MQNELHTQLELQKKNREIIETLKKRVYDNNAQSYTENYSYQRDSAPIDRWNELSSSPSYASRPFSAPGISPIGSMARPPASPVSYNNSFADPMPDLYDANVGLFSSSSPNRPSYMHNTDIELERLLMSSTKSGRGEDLNEIRSNLMKNEAKLKSLRKDVIDKQKDDLLERTKPSSKSKLLLYKEKLR